jgi:hypothetical protein
VTIDLLSRLSDLHGRLDILLVTHHGSRYATREELLDLTRPRHAVLSVGPNGYDHPTPETVAALKAVPSTIWCTDVNGSTTVTIFTSATTAPARPRRRARRAIPEPCSSLPAEKNMVESTPVAAKTASHFVVDARRMVAATLAGLESPASRPSPRATAVC